MRRKADDAPDQRPQLQITRLHQTAMRASNTSLPTGQVTAMSQIDIGNHYWCWFYWRGVRWGLAPFPCGSAEAKSTHTCTHPHITHFDHEDVSSMWLGNDCNSVHIHAVQRLGRRESPWPANSSNRTYYSPYHWMALGSQLWSESSSASTHLEEKWNKWNRVALPRLKNRMKIKRRKTSWAWKQKRYPA